MKSQNHTLSLLTCLLATWSLVAPSVQAATIDWDGSDSTAWATGANWVGGTAPANDLTTDIANFNLATYGGNPVFAPSTPGDHSISGITIGGSNGAMTISTTTGTSRLRIGANGITIAAGAGAFTLGALNSHGASLRASQTWTNNSSSLATVASITTTAANTLTFAGSGTGGHKLLSRIDNGVSVVVDLPSGTVEFAGTTTNTYTGNTTVSAGTLLITNSSNQGTGTGSVSVGASGTLGGSGFVTANGTSKTVSIDGILMGGNGTAATGAALRVTSTGGISLNDNSVIKLTLGASNAHTSIDFTGNAGGITFDSNQAFTFINAQEGTYQNILVNVGVDPGTTGTWLVTNSGYTGVFEYDGANIDLTLTAIPEPSTWALLALGFIAALALRRRRQA